MLNVDENNTIIAAKRLMVCWNILQKSMRKLANGEGSITECDHFLPIQLW